MSNKTIGIAAGAAVVIAGAAGGGYMLINDQGDSAAETTTAASASASSDADDDEVPLAAVADVMPQGVDAYLEIPSVRGLAQGTAKVKAINVGLLDLLRSVDEVGEAFAKAFDLTPAEGSKLVSSFKSVGVGALTDAPEPLAGIVVSSNKPKIVKKWLGTKRFKKDGKIGERDKYTLSAREEGAAKDNLYLTALSGAMTPPGTGVVWLENKGALAIGTDAFLTQTAAVADGKGKALGASATYKEDIKRLDDGTRMFLYAPATIYKKLPIGETFSGFVDDAGPGLFGITMDKPGILLTFYSGLGGKSVPVLDLPKVPKLTLAEKLPANTFGYAAFSTEFGMSGADLEKRLVELAKQYTPASADEIEKELGEGRRHLGVGLSDLVDAGGDQGVVFTVTKETELGPDDFDKLDINTNIAVMALFSLKSEEGMKKVIDAVKKVAPIGRTHTVAPASDGGFEATGKGTAPFATVRYPKGQLFIGLGPEDMVKKALADIEAGTATLGADKAHALGVKGTPGTPWLRSWVDASRVLRKVMAEAPTGPLAPLGDLKEKLVLQGDDRLTMTTGVTVARKGDAYRYRVDMLNSVGVLPALGIYGVERYLSSSKTAEAKNTIGAISRGAAAAFEREGEGGHTLCKSAPAVPATVPSGAKYAPKPGADYETGDESTGWKCLRFSMTQPHYFQYGYTQGGPYKGPAVGGPDPGKDGFEAWAVGDLDGDGVTSLFTRIGTVDKATGSVKLGTQIFIHNEHE